MNLVRPLSRSCWLVERGLDQVVGVIVRLDGPEEFVVHVARGRAVGFLTSEEAFQFAVTINPQETGPVRPDPVE